MESSVARTDKYTLILRFQPMINVKGEVLRLHATPAILDVFQGEPLNIEAREGCLVLSTGTYAAPFSKKSSVHSQNLGDDVSPEFIGEYYSDVSFTREDWLNPDFSSGNK